MKISIETIPHHEQRYVTCGDYWDGPDGTKQVRVSALGDWRMELLIAVHEIIEAALCDARGISEPDVKAWDEAHPDDDPGALPDAPYHKEHMFAERLERLLALELGVNWDQYDERVEALFG